MDYAANVITAHEYAITALPAAQLDHDTGTRLWQQYDRDRGVLALDFPSPRTNHCWQITPRGWAGFIRVSPRLALSLQPRLPLHDLFGMLHTAHNLQSFHILPGLVHVQSLPALYDRLAITLAAGVLQQARKGLAGAYVNRRQRLPYVRGRIVPQPAAAPSAPPTVLCDYDDWTTDTAANQILSWTLHTIARAAICRSATQAQVQHALRALAGQVSLQPTTAAACRQQRYDRLNAAYEPLHALCHFFLSHSTPSHHQGTAPMPAFLVNMPRLYEQFVAASLRRHLPPGWRLREQETLQLPGQPSTVQFTLDLVIYDDAHLPRVVLDTKYRQPQRAATADIAQVVAYARAKNCRRAVLLYPQLPDEPLDTYVGDTRVQAFAFGVGEQTQHDAEALLTAIQGGK